jgi:hypothetical protein
MFLIHKKFVDTLKKGYIQKKYLKIDMHMCLNIVMQLFFQNTWTKGSHVSKFTNKVK